jgi:4-amino-4-deoxy-L-arabinose transferase-like glycosyltransferase
VTAATEQNPPPRGLIYWFEACLGTATSSRTRIFLLLGLIALVTFLPGLRSIPPIDRDESRYAQASKQMMESGNYIDIRFQDKPRYLQPVGIYWLHVAAARLTGWGADAPIWVHRLPSLFGATFAVLLTFWVAIPLAGETAALIAALFVAVSVLLGFEARDAKIDAVLLSAVLAAMGFLARAYLQKPLTLLHSLLFWVALGAGVMLKGPIILLVLGLTAAFLCFQERSTSWLRTLRPLPGTGVMLALILPWLIAITMIHGTEFFRVALGPSMLGKVASGQQSHGLPPGMYLVLYWITFWPAAALVIPAAPWIWRNRKDRAVRFCLAWIIPTWLMFELIVTKLPHYVLPVYPAIAILLALALNAGRRPATALTWTMITGVFIYVTLVVGGLYALERQISIGVILLAVTGAAMFTGGLLQARRLTAKAFAFSLVLGAICLHAAAFGLVLPRLDSVWVVPRVVNAVTRTSNCPQPKIAAAGFYEPSLVFLAGTDTNLTTADGAADFLQKGGCRVAIVEAREEAPFLARMREQNLHPVLRERVKGIAIGRLRRVDLGIFMVAP